MKNKDSYIFTSDKKPYQMLCRETLTIGVNKAMRAVAGNIDPNQTLPATTFVLVI